MWVDKGNPWLLQFWCGSYGWGLGFFLFLIASQLTDLKSENKINFFSSIYSTFDQSRQTLYLPREAVTLSRKHQVLEGRRGVSLLVQSSQTAFRLPRAKQHLHPSSKIMVLHRYKASWFLVCSPVALLKKIGTDKVAQRGEVFPILFLCPALWE